MGDTISMRENLLSAVQWGKRAAMAGQVSVRNLMVELETAQRLKQVLPFALIVLNGPVHPVTARLWPLCESV